MNSVKDITTAREWLKVGLDYPGSRKSSSFLVNRVEVTLRPVREAFSNMHSGDRNVMLS